MNRWKLPAYGKRLIDAVQAGVRWIIIRGGRGGGKSWSVAFIVLLVGAQRRVDVLCLREHETTLVESMYRLMEIIMGRCPRSSGTTSSGTITSSG